MIKRLYKIGLAMLVICISLSIACVSIYAALDIKVGYYDYDGYVTVDENGRIIGYAGEILDMLTAVNTHWNFVPVRFERGAFLENMRKGFAVISVQSPKGISNPRFFAYSEYPVGIEYGIFYTSLEQNINYEDFTIFNGMRVGTIDGDMQNALFDVYQRENDFSVEYHTYNSLDEIIQALHDKDIDGLIYGSTVEQPDLKIVARYAQTPLHVAANEWGAMFIDFFDRKLREVYQSDPDFQKNLYEKYFGDSPRAVQALTLEEEAALFESNKQAAIEADLAELEAARLAAEEEARLEAQRLEQEQAAAAAAAAAENNEGQTSAVLSEDEINKRLQDRAIFWVAIGLLILVVTGTITGKYVKRAAVIKNRLAPIKASGAQSKAAAKAMAADSGKQTKSRRSKPAKQEAAMIEAQGSTTEPEHDRMRAATNLREPEPAYPGNAQAQRMDSEITQPARETEPTPLPVSSRRDQVFPVWIEDSRDTEEAQIASTGDSAFSDDQIRGEIYLSGLSLSLQPRYSVSQNRIIGAEVSISCRHPIRERIYPEELVQSLSQKGRLYMLDRYIFDSLCIGKPHERVDYGDDFELVIPVFTESVIQPDFSRWYIDTAASYGVPPEFFRLDLVYRWNPSFDQPVYSSLAELSNAGFRLALKDVGSVNYPLSLLCEVEAAAIVASEQLVIEALGSVKKKKLLMALRSMCDHMGYILEADRVDSREKFQLLTEVGCQVFQGNLLTRAIPYDQFWDMKRKLDLRYA